MSVRVHRQNVLNSVQVQGQSGQSHNNTVLVFLACNDSLGHLV